MFVGLRCGEQAPYPWLTRGRYRKRPDRRSPVFGPPELLPPEFAKPDVKPEVLEFTMPTLKLPVLPKPMSWLPAFLATRVGLALVAEILGKSPRPVLRKPEPPEPKLKKPETLPPPVLPKPETEPGWVVGLPKPVL